MKEAACRSVIARAPGAGKAEPASARDEHRLIGAVEIFGDDRIFGGETAGQAAEGGQNQPLRVARETGARNRPAADAEPQFGMEMPGDFGPRLAAQALVAKDDAVDGQLVGDLAAPRAAGEPVVIAGDPQQPLPPYDSHDTLDRLAALADQTGARAIWCRGDSFHDRNAAARIGPAVAERLARQAASARLLWVAGNHDGLTGGAWGGEVADELAVDGIVFRHQSLAHETRPEISGHFHPKLRINVRGRPIARPCFAGDARRLILPAFGSLTGGLAAEDPVIAENFDGPYEAMLVARGRRLRFPCAGRGRDDATASRLLRQART